LRPSFKKSSILVEALDRAHHSTKAGSKNDDTGAAFDARHLTDCPRRIVGRRLVSEVETRSARDELNTLLDAGVKSKWLSIFEKSTRPKIVSRDYLACNNVLRLRMVVDAVLKFEGRTVVAIFKHASSHRMRRLAAMGPRRPEVVSLNAAMDMLGCFDAIAVYDHGDRHLAFHIQRSESVVAAISSKCRKMADYLILSRMPQKCPAACQMRDCEFRVSNKEAKAI